MKVLVVGSGGREHALAWRLEREGIDVRVAPGNGGTPHRLALTSTEELAAYARDERMDLTIVGPEAPLAAGLVDDFTRRGLRVFGPTQAAARLEWSKAWAKDFLLRYGIPTARAEILNTESEIRTAIRRHGFPIVLKADGLAGGKGVFVVTTPAEVDGALDQLRALNTDVLMEEYLEGPELSVLAFTDGERYALMPPARDYKRLLEGDRGPNTGGMGGLTWPAHASQELLNEVERTILRPTLAGMAKEGNAYRGVLYVGLMLTREDPKVLEFNCRFGDPECQLILPLMDSKLFETCASIAENCFEPDSVRWRSGRTFGVVLASRGYPNAPETGEAVRGLDELPTGVIAFHAGTRDAGGQIVTAGGRVLTLVGEEREAVYRAADIVSFAGKHFRRDIGIEINSRVGVSA